MMKKSASTRSLLALLVVFTLCLSLLPASAMADDVNSGETLSENTGTVDHNYGTVGDNYGTITDNFGEVGVNAAPSSEQSGGPSAEGAEGTVTSGGLITNNGSSAEGAENSTAIVGINNGTVTKNNAGGTIGENNGTITNPNAGNITVNNADLGTNASTGVIGTNNATITDNLGKVETNAAPLSEQSGGPSAEGTVTSGGVITNNGSSAERADNSTAIVGINNGTVVNNYAGATIGENKGTITNPNAGNITVNNADLDANASTGVIGENNAKIADNDGKVVDNGSDKKGADNSKAVVVQNDGVIETNNAGAAVTTNNKTVEDNNGRVENNNAGGTVTNNKYGATIGENNGTVGTNFAKVGENNGTIEVNWPSGTVGNNNADATIGVNNGEVKHNNKDGVVLNYGVGMVENNYGAVYNYGGMVQNNVGTHYFSVEIVNTTFYTESKADGLIEAYNQQWLGQTENTVSTATVTLTPAAGYEITSIQTGGNLQNAVENDDGTWTLTFVSGANIRYDVPESTKVAPRPGPKPVDPDIKPVPVPDPDPWLQPVQPDNFFLLTYRDSYTGDTQTVAYSVGFSAPAAPQGNTDPFDAFMDEKVEAVKDAPKNGSVVIDLRETGWNNLKRGIFEAAVKHGEVEIIIYYCQWGKDFKLIIPAGTAYDDAMFEAEFIAASQVGSFCGLTPASI